MRYDSPPLQGLSETWRGKQFLEFFSHLNRRGGVPSRAAALIVMGERGISTYLCNPHNTCITLAKKVQTHFPPVFSCYIFEKKFNSLSLLYTFLPQPDLF